MEVGVHNNQHPAVYAYNIHIYCIILVHIAYSERRVREIPLLTNNFEVGLVSKFEYVQGGQ